MILNILHMVLIALNNPEFISLTINLIVLQMTKGRRRRVNPLQKLQEFIKLDPSREPRAIFTQIISCKF